jgi:hypothetical protein
MLVASENFYFDEIGAAAVNLNNDPPKAATIAPFAGVTSLGRPMEMYAGT